MVHICWYGSSYGKPIIYKYLKAGFLVVLPVFGGFSPICGRIGGSGGLFLELAPLKKNQKTARMTSRLPAVSPKCLGQQLCVLVPKCLIGYGSCMANWIQDGNQCAFQALLAKPATTSPETLPPILGVFYLPTWAAELPGHSSSNTPSNIARNIGGVSPPCLGSKLPDTLPRDSGNNFPGTPMLHCLWRLGLCK